jgi:hypothetical protein
VNGRQDLEPRFTFLPFTFSVIAEKQRATRPGGAPRSDAGIAE